VTQAVITVPAYFNDKSAPGDKDAGKIAGLDVCASSMSLRPPRWPMAWIEKVRSKLPFTTWAAGTFDIPFWMWVRRL